MLKQATYCRRRVFNKSRVGRSLALLPFQLNRWTESAIFTYLTFPPSPVFQDVSLSYHSSIIKRAGRLIGALPFPPPTHPPPSDPTHGLPPRKPTPYTKNGHFICELARVVWNFQMMDDELFTLKPWIMLIGYESEWPRAQVVPNGPSIRGS